MKKIKARFLSEAGRTKTEGVLSLLLALCLVLSAFSFSFAVTSKEKREEAKEAGKQAEAAEEEAKKAEAQSEEAEQQAKEAEEQAVEMEGRIEQAIEDISAKQASIDEMNALIAETGEKMTRKQEEIDEQEALLDERLTAMYKTGTVGFVDVLLSSNNVDELMTNLTMVQAILSSDKDLVRSLREDYEDLELLKTTQESQELALESERAELEATKAAYQEEAEAYRAQQEQLQQEAASLAAEALAKQQEAEAKLEEKRKALAEAAEAEKKEKEEEARKKAEAEAAADGNPTIENSGDYVWPCDGPLTSYYGWRIHPIFGTRMYHSGYDIAANTGTPVLAAGDGLVTMASWYGGYGNCVQVYIGDGYTALYGHLSDYAVSEGDFVVKGQVVGYVGSTGWSTGPHLHYSVLLNGEYVDPYVLY